MTAFQQFRLWARRAPLAERLSAASAAIVLLAALSWLLVPASSHSTALQSVQSGGSIGSGGGAVSGSTTTVPGSGTGQTTVPLGSGLTGPGQSVSGGSPQPVSGGNAPSAPGGSAAAQQSGPNSGGGSPSASSGLGPSGPTPPRGSGCTSPPGSDQGVTATQISVAILIINIAGPTGNAATGTPSPDEQQQDYQAVVDSINASGGVACRKLVPVYFSANAADQGQLQQVCLDVAGAGVYMAFDPGAYGLYTGLVSCYAAHGVPFYEGVFLSSATMAHSYPYLFSTASEDIFYRNVAFALAKRGFFGPADGFRELGYVYEDCDSQVPGEFQGWLHQAGLTSSQIVSYDLGCPAALYPSPSQVEQAVLTFEADHVTNVTETHGDFAQFTTVAQQQGFHPKYGIPDDDVVDTSYGTTHPDYTNIANAIAIANKRFGEERTVNYSPDPPTARCNGILSGKNLPPVYQQGDGLGGIACDQMWLLAGMVDHSPSMSRAALPLGLEALGSSDFSYPYGPGDFKGSRVTYGGQFWRTDQFLESCSCWQVVDRTFQPGFS